MLSPVFPGVLSFCRLVGFVSWQIVFLACSFLASKAFGAFMKEELAIKEVELVVKEGLAIKEEHVMKEKLIMKSLI